jgi:hypothetical protein
LDGTTEARFDGAAGADGADGRIDERADGADGMDGADVIGLSAGAALGG